MLGVLLAMIVMVALGVGVPVYLVASQWSSRTHHPAVCDNQSPPPLVSPIDQRQPFAEAATMETVRAISPTSDVAPRRSAAVSDDNVDCSPDLRRLRLVVAENELAAFWRVAPAAARLVIEDWARTVEVDPVDIAALVIEEVRSYWLRVGFTPRLTGDSDTRILPETQEPWAQEP